MSGSFPVGEGKKFHLFVSANNPGALELASEMATRYPQLELAAPADWQSLPQQPRLGPRVFEARAYFLLGLNKWTFLGEEGSRLAAEVAEARAMGLRIALAHETDVARGGCEFGNF